MARLDDLPAEVLMLLLTHLNPTQAQLARLALVSRCLSGPAQYLLFANASIKSLDQFDALLHVLQPVHRPPRPLGPVGKADPDSFEDEDDGGEEPSPWARALGTTRLKVECTTFGEKGWGTRLGRLLRVGANVHKFEVRGLHDLRIKFLQGRGGELFRLARPDQVGQFRIDSMSSTGATSLSITSTTFKNHALTTSPDLATFVRSVRHLTLANLGLPFPSTHLHQIIIHCARNLEYLALSALRDLNSSELLVPLVALLRPASAPRLRHLRFGSLDKAQAALLALPECLPGLCQVVRLDWTFPFPTRDLLDATPAGVQVLVLKPRAGAQDADKEERMLRMGEEDKVVAALMEVLGSGALARGGGRGVREVWWGGAAAAGRRLGAAAAGDQVRIRLANEW